MRKWVTEMLFVGCALALVTPGIARAQAIENYKLPATFLKGVKPSTAHPSDNATAVARKKNAGLAGTVTSNASNSGVPGIDSIQNWVGQFTASGFDPNGNAETVWPYAMVGKPPESNSTSHIRVPIIPVTVVLLDSNGKPGHDSRTGALLSLSVTPTITDAVIHSPLFESVQYTSGTGQFNDQMQRAEFWNRIVHGTADDDEDGWHTLLHPQLKTTRTMSIPYGYAYYALNSDGTCCAYMLIDANTFGNLLFPPTYPVDNTTVIGAAELAGDMTTRDLSTLLFNNIYLYDTKVTNCCILGYHTYDFEPGIPQNGNLPRLYVMNYSSWISPMLFGGGFEDITAMSHEVSETFNDPFVNNITPWWLSVDPISGNGNCQDDLETGDVVEVLSINPVYAVAHHNRTYHLQNEALFPWFAFESPSPARLAAYSFPDETTLLSLSPANLLPGCKAAP